MKILTFTIVLSVLALAEPKYTPAYQKCIDKATSNQASWQCADKERQHWDKILNSTYKKLMAKYKDRPKKQKELRKLQRAWIAYRDLNCEFYIGLNDDPPGTMEQGFYRFCLMRMTAQRAQELQDFLIN